MARTSTALGGGSRESSGGIAAAYLRHPEQRCHCDQAASTSRPTRALRCICHTASWHSAAPPMGLKHARRNPGQDREQCSCAPPRRDERGTPVAIRSRLLGLKTPFSPGVCESR